ncbi:TnsA endonuclease N-terminal domain-containing protein [Cyanobacteria bacterium FACHB-63]|nr:TnsA endonuclease N-terminal domain-containing protein [Cyanobacteria bacterium FACHB-63]
MPRRRGDWNEEKFDRLLEEKRGEGVRDQYSPWITVRDFPSKGRVSRARGWKTNRLHHLFSDHETRLFYILEWSDVVIDIREQFPLLDIELAQKISIDIGVKYPVDTASKFPRVLTTDFMVTVKQDGKVRDVALTVKPSSELKNKRVIEKFEIERNYYMAKGIEWGLVTEKHIPKLLARNIEWVHGAYRLEENSKKKIQDLPILRTELCGDNAVIAKA